MANVSAFEAKTRFGELLDRVLKGEETEDERQMALGWLRGLQLRVDHEMASLVFPNYQSWPLLISCPSMTRPILSWHYGRDECSAARMAH